MLDERLAVVERTLSDTMGDVKAEALVNTLDALAEVEAKRLGDTQLIKTLAHTLV